MTSPSALPTPEQDLKVRADTNPGSLAKSIQLTLLERTDATVKVRAMGPGPVNQMMKALIIARQNLAAQGKDINILPYFETAQERGEDITVIVTKLTLFDS